MLKKDRAIILRTDDFMETSLILSAITKEDGMMKFLAKGAKRLKSPLRMSFELFSESELIFYYKPEREFNIVKEGKILKRFPGIYENYSKYELASKVSQFLIKTIPQGSGQESYEELHNFLKFLDKAERINLLLYGFFVVRYLQREGLLPQFESCQRCKQRKADFFLEELKISVCRSCLENGEIGAFIDKGTRAEINFILSKDWKELNNLELREHTKKLLLLIGEGL